MEGILRFRPISFNPLTDQPGLSFRFDLFCREHLHGYGDARRVSVRPTRPHGVFQKCFQKFIHLHTFMVYIYIQERNQDK